MSSGVSITMIDGIHGFVEMRDTDLVYLISGAQKGLGSGSLIRMLICTNEAVQLYVRTA